MASAPMLGTPPSHAGHELGEVVQRNLKVHLPKKNGSTSGNNDHGQTAAKNKPASVPGRLRASGMVFSSTSISDAASINQMRIA